MKLCKIQEIKLAFSDIQLALRFRASFFPFYIHFLLKNFILWTRKLILKNVEDTSTRWSRVVLFEYFFHVYVFKDKGNNPGAILLQQPQESVGLMANQNSVKRISDFESKILAFTHRKNKTTLKPPNPCNE